MAVLFVFQLPSTAFPVIRLVPRIPQLDGSDEFDAIRLLEALKVFLKDYVSPSAR